ncbi:MULTISPECIES: SSI family serine proteinase inhibitor [unclassified Streptomyces]|uniref:SSI family serine proteinase inhibitor n=1 Tax=unclassified Streptomyces TaxID=2593676 RepID=UPI002E2B3065|nr:SSI family serine proteinase inhibitor [Streptomyces sp. NBC_00228]
MTHTTSKTHTPKTRSAETRPPKTRTRKATALRSALLATALVLLAGQAPAQATAPHHGVRGDWLYLTVTRGDSRSSDTRGTLLLCDPPQGHAHAAEACAELAVADGDIDALPPKSVFCPMIYAPVTAHARGEWKGRPVDYSRTFSNACSMAARTGHVFALDS